MQIEFTFPGAPVPAQRPRVVKGHTYTPKKYDQYKKALAKSLFQEYGYFSWDFPPPGSKERSKWLKNNRYTLKVSVFQEVNRGDIDNFLKTVMDAITQAGLIADDSQIDSVEGTKAFDKQNPRIEFRLNKL